MRSLSIIFLGMFLFFNTWGCGNGAKDTFVTVVPVARRITVSNIANGLMFDLGDGTKMKFALIPSGKFMMGTAIDSNDSSVSFMIGLSDEYPPHNVTFAKSFYMGVSEVTQSQYQAVMGSNPSHIKGPDYPVESITWYEATSFCKKLSKMSGMIVRLPSEAEWEYACRAGSTTKYNFGDDGFQLEQHAWFSGNCKSTSHSVAMKNPNTWGLYDMYGNVSEWCLDHWNKNYEDAPNDGAAWLTGDSSKRVVRGGSWYDLARYCRSSDRGVLRPEIPGRHYGFRIVVLMSEKGN